MFRKRGQKALYEVIVRRPVKSSSDKTIGPLRSQKEVIRQQNEGNSNFEEPERIEWPLKAKAMQFFKGRLDISLPYTVVIAIGLIIILLLLICFRLGQIWPKS